MAQPVPNPPPGFEMLSVDEKIEYVESLWDQIVERGDIPIPDWHRELLRERLEAYRADPTAGRPGLRSEPNLSRSIRPVAERGDAHCSSERAARHRRSALLVSPTRSKRCSALHRRIGRRVRPDSGESPLGSASRRARSPRAAPASSLYSVYFTVGGDFAAVVAVLHRSDVSQSTGTLAASWLTCPLQQTAAPRRDLSCFLARGTTPRGASPC